MAQWVVYDYFLIENCDIEVAIENKKKLTMMHMLSFEILFMTLYGNYHRGHARGGDNYFDVSSFFKINHES